MMSRDVVERKPDTSGFHACEIDPAQDWGLMCRALELRFQVYCLEQGFLDAIDYPHGYEVDAHDGRALHFASCSKAGEIAGYVRLVGADADGMFPFQTHCKAVFAEQQLPPAHLSAEVSRLMVDSAHRRHLDRSPDILFGMFHQMYVCSLRQGVRYWFAAMERSLVRVLQRMLNIQFRQIGPVTDYYGPVAPYLIDLDVVTAHISAWRPELIAAA
jgi:N-acyl-L-homoserine lactone synthetase